MPPPVIVMVPLLVPTVAVVGSTLTVTVPLFDPEAGLTVSQLMASLTLQDPLDVIDKDWLAGWAAPWVALKFKLAGLAVNVAAAGAETVSVTGIDWGELLAPDPMTLIEAGYVPAASPDMLTVAVKEFGAVPETGESASQELVELTLQLNVPVRELLTVTVCEAGLLPPCVAEKARLVGLRLIVGIVLISLWDLPTDVWLSFGAA
jgi:hypothetical protein